MSCIFCRIAEGELDAKKVLENERIVAFHDLNPQAPTHVLLIPKKHIDGLATASDEDKALLGELQLAARDVAAELGLDKGYRVVINNGRGAGQSVDHVHYHLLGGRRLTWPPG